MIRLTCAVGFLALALICDLGALGWHAERPHFAASLLLLATLFTALGLGFFWKISALQRKTPSGD